MEVSRLLSSPQELSIYQRLLTRMPSEFESAYSVELTRQQRTSLRNTKAALRAALPSVPTQDRQKLTKRLIEDTPDGWKMALVALQTHGFEWEPTQWETLAKAATKPAGASTTGATAAASATNALTAAQTPETKSKATQQRALPRHITEELASVPLARIQAHCLRYVSERLPRLVSQALQDLLREVQSEELQAWVTDSDNDSSSADAATTEAGNPHQQVSEQESWLQTSDIPDAKTKEPHRRLRLQSQSMSPTPLGGQSSASVLPGDYAVGDATVPQRTAAPRKRRRTK